MWTIATVYEPECLKLSSQDLKILVSIAQKTLLGLLQSLFILEMHLISITDHKEKVK